MSHVREEVIENLLQEFRALEERLADPQTAVDPKRLMELSRERARLEPVVDLARAWQNFRSQWEEIQKQLALEKDSDMISVLRDELTELESALKRTERELQLALLPKDPDSGKDVFVEIRAGTGGEEAALFARDLLRMYLRYLEKKKISVEIMDISESPAGGIKEAIFAARGPEAFDLLHREAGGHRVQRIPATEANGRIHTSAVTVAVLPQIEEDELTLNPADIRIDVMRASGAGGQHVNKTESAVRLTHLPTGIVVYMQEEKSQMKNREKAMQVLRARIYEKEKAEKHEKLAAEKKAQVGSGDRSDKIRTYNFPQNRVTDHRIGYTAYNLDQVLEGDLDDLIQAIQVHRQQELLQEIN